MSKKFEYLDSKQVAHEIEISQDDLNLVQEHEIITDQKMQSKPTTFFKDAMKRFSKNKSSVVGGCILGFLVLCAIFLPMMLPSDVSDGVVANNYQTKLYPKLFEAGTGWWDGCKDVNNVILTVDYETYDETGVVVGMPAGDLYKDNAVVGGSDGVTCTAITYENNTNENGFGGYVRLYGRSQNYGPMIVSPVIDEFDYSEEQGITLTLETSSSAIIGAGDWSSSWGKETPYNISFMFTARDSSTYRNTVYTVPLVTGITEYGTFSYNLDNYIETIRTEINGRTISDPRFAISCDPTGELSSDGTTYVFANLLISGGAITATDETLSATLDEKYTFYDANSMLLSDISSSNYWPTYSLGSNNSSFSAYRVQFFYGSFRYDTYEDALGDYTETDVGYANLQTWVNKGWVKITATVGGEEVDGLTVLADDYLTGKTRSEVQAIADTLKFEILNDRCPFVSEDEITVTVSQASSTSSVLINIGGTVTRWKALFPNYDSCPKYLFGTDAEGKDLLKYVAEGLRTSLILGLITFIVCFSFGLVYGAIAGYYGGWTDILMERVTDILGGIPWVVVMTLAIIKWGSNFTTFVLALCFTGWIGTSSTTRTQFYRYKNREYILAARTLGASDKRLIFRHILPNAIGTIVTSSVLMIPSVIYSEATLAYLNLGLNGLSSFGVILSDNQAYIQTESYMILFPSVVMAILMICFNLFGNGLRDAFNPSLKGAEN